MFPHIQLGSWTVSTYSLMYTLAFIVAGGLGMHRLDSLQTGGREWRRAVPYVLIAVLVGLFGLAWLEAKIRSGLTGLPLESIFIRVYYGLAGAVLAMLIYARVRRLPLLPATDQMVACFALGFAIARVGCLAAGCCGGAEAHGDLLAMYPPNTDGVWAMRYSTQIASMIVQLALFVYLSSPQIHPRWLRPAGRVTFFYVFAFCLERFVLEFFRYDYRPLLGPLSLPHILMLVMLGVSLYALLRAQKPAAPTTLTSPR